MQGRMIKFEPGAVIHDIASGDVAGVGVILSGLATTTVSNALTLQEGGAADEPDAMRAATVYLTHGSVFGVLVTMTGTDMPGRSNIVSHGSSRGTHVFQVPASVIRLVRLLPDGMTMLWQTWTVVLPSSTQSVNPLFHAPRYGPRWWSLSGRDVPASCTHVYSCICEETARVHVTLHPYCLETAIETICSRRRQAQNVNADGATCRRG
jgi:hypothetical protein